jgi:Spy/CpxP family protein refolding chaperone
MTHGKLNIPLLIFLLLLSWNGPEKMARAGTVACSGAAEMSRELHLDDDQVKAVREICAANRRAMQALLRQYDLRPADLRMVRREMSDFRRQGSARMSVVLDAQQLQAFWQEMDGSSGRAFTRLPGEEKPARLQKTLHLSAEQAEQVLALYEQAIRKRNDLLQRLGVSPEEMAALQQQMMRQRSEARKQLSAILDKEQMDRFSEFTARMGNGPGGSGQSLLFPEGDR